MKLLEIVREVRRHLEQNGRVSYRMLQREFGLEGDALEELMDELVDIQQVARREKGALAWLGDGQTSAAEQPPPHAERQRPYTPKHLADKILTSRSALEGERKQVTVLFADMQGSTELTTRLDAEEWHAVMDSFLTILADGVHHFEGTVNQYTGDGIMALFGAPIAHEDHAQRACYAALRMRDELRRHADVLRIERGQSFSVRMGLHSGEVVVGKIGDDLRMDYTARGHTVHLASRMEQIAEPGAIYLSDSSARRVEGYFELRDLGRTRVKGVRKPVGVSELVGTGKLETRFDLSRARGLTPFVGRDREMAQLEAALERARSGRAQIVGVVAEAGTGKSRLCWEFAERCRAREARVFSVTCAAHGRSIPFSLYRSLLRALFDVSERDSDEAARNKVAGTMVRQDPGLAAHVPFVLDFLGLAEAGQALPSMDADAHEREFMQLARRLAESRGDELVVEIADDLHWIDRASEVAHLEIQGMLEQKPNLTVLNYRPEHRPLEADRPNFEELRLEPLSAESTAELLAELLGADGCGRGLEERVQARAAGNPFFVEEIVRSLVESGHLEGAPGAYRLARAVGSIEVPESVRGVLAARIDRLGEQAKRTLQAAAVIGKSFGSKLLSDVLGRDTRRVGETLHSLASSEYVLLEVAYPDEIWQFKHPLTQEVAYATLLRSTRQRIHAAVARALAAGEPTDPETLSLLAYHWEGADKPLEAARCHQRAAPGVFSDPAGYDHAIRVRELLASVRQTNETRRLRLWALSQIVSWGMFREGSLEQLKEILEEARPLVRDPDDRTELANLLAGASGVATMSGDAGLGRALAEEAVGLADAGDNLMTQLMARLRIAESLQLVAPLDEQLRVFDEEIAFARERLQGEPGLAHGVTAVLEWWRGRVLALQGRVADAERAYADGERMLVGVGQGSVTVTVLERLRAALEVQRGNSVAALHHATRCLETAEQVGTRFHVAEAWGTLGEALLLDGRWSEAAHAVERANAEAAHTPARQWMRWGLLAVLVRAQLELGDGESALTAARQAVEWADGKGPIHYGIDCHLAMALVLLGTSGKRARAKIQRELESAEELIDRSGAQARRPHLHLARAQLAERLGKSGDHEHELREAHRLFIETGATGHAERLARQLAEGPS